MHIRFWGTQGSIAKAGALTVRHGDFYADAILSDDVLQVPDPLVADQREAG